jgi:hypothetical protein
MEKSLFKDLEPAERLRALESNCDRLEEASYMKQFTHDDLVGFKEELSDVSINLNDIAVEKAEITKAFAEKAKEPTKRRVEILKYLKEKAVSVTEGCFVFLDQESGEAYFFNGEGDQVFSRPLLPKEKQKTMFGQLRAAQ